MTLWGWLRLEANSLVAIRENHGRKLPADYLGVMPSSGHFKGSWAKPGSGQGWIPAHPYPPELAIGEMPCISTAPSLRAHQLQAPSNRKPCGL